jgi:hypothetical protein
MVHQGERLDSTKNQAVCVEGEKPSKTMAKWHHKGGANAREESEVDQACS